MSETPENVQQQVVDAASSISEELLKLFGGNAIHAAAAAHVAFQILKRDAICKQNLH